MTIDQSISQKSFSQLLTEAIAREQKTGIEICTSCANDMDFPSRLHVDHPLRYVGGAYYGVGGQTCAFCAAKEKSPIDDPYGDTFATRTLLPYPPYEISLPSDLQAPHQLFLRVLRRSKKF